MDKNNQLKNVENKTSFFEKNKNIMSRELLDKIFQESIKYEFNTSYLTFNNVKFLLDCFQKNNKIDIYIKCIEEKEFLKIINYINIIATVEIVFKTFLFSSFSIIESSIVANFQGIVSLINKNKLTEETINNILEENNKLLEKDRIQTLSLSRMKKIFKFTTNPSMEVIFLSFNVIGKNKNNYLNEFIIIEEQYFFYRKKEHMIIMIRNFVMHPTSLLGLKKLKNSFSLLSHSGVYYFDTLFEEIKELIYKELENEMVDELMKTFIEDILNTIKFVTSIEKKTQD